MRVILQEKVTNLGNIGDVVTVKPGYSRNFLIPQRKAVKANAANIKEFENKRAEFEKKEADRLVHAQERAAQLATMVLKLSAKASDEGKLFGSITLRDIAEAAQKAGVALNKSEVNLPDGPLRVTGEYDISVTLHSEVNATVKILIEADKS